jgi:transposase-like protein
MNSKSPFKWRHFPPDIILWGVRWYCLYPISYRQLEEMMCVRGVEVDHSTLSRWVQKYAPEIDKRCRPYLKPTNDSWRVDETYIKVKGEDRYLYRAVDSQGNTLDFLLTAKRDAQAAKRFLRKTLQAPHTQEPSRVRQSPTAGDPPTALDSPRVINVDKNPAYPKAIQEMKVESELPVSVELRQNKHLNNRIEQDHRFIKRLTKPGMGFDSFNTARRTLRGIEAMNMRSYWTSRGSQKRRC